jgi:hypothetical protein
LLKRLDGLPSFFGDAWALAAMLNHSNVFGRFENGAASSDVVAN